MCVAVMASGPKPSTPRTPDYTSLLNQVLSPPSSGKSSPLNGLPGPARTCYSHISSLIGYIKQWLDIQSKGIICCRAVQALRLHEIIGLEYPPQLKPLCDSLTDIVDAMSDLIDSMQEISTRCIALSKLLTSSEPVFNTWSAEKISVEVANLITMFSRETAIKKLVKENIAHCRDENLCEVYVSAWEFNTNINSLSIEIFLTESNLENGDTQW